MGKFFFWLIPPLLGGGCLVQERCFTDADCVSSMVCRQGECAYECTSNEDCDEAFGREYVCERHRCKFPEVCSSCSFPNAAALCVHGVCVMGECRPGFKDADGDPANGCEEGECQASEEVCDGFDNDCDGEIDEDGVCQLTCPDDMVLVEDSFCLDRYEASRPDATVDSHGSDESRAESKPGVLPWMVNPMNSAALQKFQAACQAAGKHLCTKAEWYQACTGPAPGRTYAFGNTFDREICNCVDTFCDDWCAEHDIAPENCNTASNCGYSYYCFHAVPTGAFPDCLNAYGAYDVAGNVWEIVPSADDGRGYEVRGGAFNCASPAVRLQCNFNAGWNELYAGFRCCREPTR